MLRAPKIPDIVLGALLAVAVFSMGAAFESSRSQPSNKNAAENAKNSRAVQTAEKPPNITDWLLVLFNGLLFGSTVLLWRVTKKSANIAESALTDLERSFIVVDNIKSDAGFYLNPLTRWDEERTNPQFTLSVINYGRTPGNIDFAAIFFVVSSNIPPEATRLHLITASPDSESIEIIIGPNKVFAFPEMRCNPRLTHADVETIMAGTHHPYCHGLFTYRDIFGNCHLTKFCRRYWRERNEWPPHGGIERNSSQ